MLWHHGAAVHRKRVNVRKRSKMLALANGSLIEMHTPRHWALTKKHLGCGQDKLDQDAQASDTTATQSKHAITRGADYYRR